VRRLLDEERVLAIVGNVGTPTAVAAIPLTNAAETVFFGAFTGAGVLRKSPPDPWVVNFRSSYAEEMAAMVDALVDEAGIAPERIALFTQRDAYGDAGFAGARAALLRRGSSQEHRVLHVRYERNTENVEGALAEILLLPEPPRAVILVGAYRPCAKFVRLAKELGLDAVFLNVSFVGVESFLEQAGEAAEGVIVTQVVPHPLSDRPGVQSYRAALAAEAPDAEPSYASLEGYQVGRVLCLALERWDGPLDRAGVRAALLALGTFDLGLGFDLTLSEQSLQASHRVLATRIEGGKVVELDWSELRALRVENP
jgi:ABC-type branched-subunit amino acid transport system substrate-binding protein